MSKQISNPSYIKQAACRNGRTMFKSLLLLVLACWTAWCAADSLSVNESSYSSNGQIIVYFSTANTYSMIEIYINDILFKTLSDPVNGITGNITIRGTVSCQMGPSAATSVLFIQANTWDMLNREGPTTNIFPMPSYTFDAAQCQPHFLIPQGDSVDVLAGADYLVIVQSPVPILNGYVNLNNELFCVLGPMTPLSTGDVIATCSGFVPCYLPWNSQFELLGQVIEGPVTNFGGPTVQLISNIQCIPKFDMIVFEPCCETSIVPLSTIQFTFEMREDQDICSYLDFNIYASNPAFDSDILIATADSLSIVTDCCCPTYLIAEWTVPCLFDNIGATTFTLSYAKILPGGDRRRQVQMLNADISTSDQCNLSLFVASDDCCSGPCSLKKSEKKIPNPKKFLSDWREKRGNVALEDSYCGPFQPGDTLNFYIHDGNIPAVGGQLGILSDDLFYSNNNQFLIASSLLNFYIVDVQNGIMGYKSISDKTNHQLTTITTIRSPSSISVYNNIGMDQIWVAGNGQLQCGGIHGIHPSSHPPTPSNFARLVAVGPTGVWIVDGMGVLWNKPTAACNDNQPWATSGLSNIAFLSSGASGVYFSTSCSSQIMHLSGLLAAAQPVPAGGPSSIMNISASNLDDSLSVVDNDGVVWLLNGLGGQWTQTSISSSQAVSNYTQDNLLVYMQGATNFVVNWISLGIIPMFNITPFYSNITLTLESETFNIEAYQSDNVPLFDTFNNALAASWIVPNDIVQAEMVVAILEYTATYPDGSSQEFISLSCFYILPDCCQQSSIKANIPGVSQRQPAKRDSNDKE